MRKPLLTLTVAALVLTGCGNSRLNPMNWFGRGQPAPVVQSGDVNPLIPTRRNGLPLKQDAPYQGAWIASVESVKVERMPGGAVVRATGTGNVQGSFDVRLTPRNDAAPENGVVTFDFRAIMPANRIVGPASARRMTAAAYLTDNQLEGVRRIRVQTAGNAIEARR